MILYNYRKGQQSPKGKGDLKMFYWFIFEDGYSVCTKGFSKTEMAHEVRKHGKMVRKVLA